MGDLYTALKNATTHHWRVSDSNTLASKLALPGCIWYPEVIQTPLLGRASEPRGSRWESGQTTDRLQSRWAWGRTPASSPSGV